MNELGLTLELGMFGIVVLIVERAEAEEGKDGSLKAD